MEKNTAGKWIVFAYGLPDHATLSGEPITGDAANITANIRIDGGAANAVDDLNPTELEDGYYVFDITAAEANGDLLSIHPASSTANVQVIGVPGAVWTRPPNFNALGIATDGDLSGNVDGNVVGSVASVTGAVGSVTGNVGGNVVGSVGSVTGNVGGIAGTIQTLDALDTAQDSQHATTQSLVTTVDTAVDGIQTDLSNATDGLGAIKTAVDAIPTSNPTVAQIVDGVWDETLTAHVTPDSAAVKVKDTLADTNELQTNQGNWLTATGFSTHSAADVRTEMDANSTKLIDILADVTGLNGATPTSLADALLNRDLSAVSDTNARSPLNALRILRNKWSITAGTLTVTKEDDTTSAWTAALTDDATANPITASDPA